MNILRGICYKKISLFKVRGERKSNTGKNKQQKANSQSHCTTRMNQYSKFNNSTFHGCGEICVEKSHYAM